MNTSAVSPNGHGHGIAPQLACRGSVDMLPKAHAPLAMGGKHMQHWAYMANHWQRLPFYMLQLCIDSGVRMLAWAPMGANEKSQGLTVPLCLVDTAAVSTRHSGKWLRGILLDPPVLLLTSGLPGSSSLPTPARPAAAAACAGRLNRASSSASRGTPPSRPAPKVDRGPAAKPVM